jgi:magnesium-transporting ATPase (P-type)
MLTTLCFDKTGTLTEDKLNLRGIVSTGVYSNIKLITTVETSSTNNNNTSTTANDGNTITGIIQDKEDDKNPLTVVTDPEEESDFIVSIMASCHSLFQVVGGGKIQGTLL